LSSLDFLGWMKVILWTSLTKFDRLVKKIPRL
jgi:hypothetical protein